MNDATEREYLSQDWMTFVDAVRHVATASEFDDDPTDNIARGLDEIREALIEGKIPIEWVGENSHGRAFNPYMLYGIGEPRSDLHWAINYIAERSEIPDPRPSYMDPDYIAELRRLRQLRLLTTRVLELWPHRSAKQPDRLLPLSIEQRQAYVREELRLIYKTSRPNQTVAEQLAGTRTGEPRSFIRPIVRENEFARLRLPPGNSRRRKPGLD